MTTYQEKDGAWFEVQEDYNGRTYLIPVRGLATILNEIADRQRPRRPAQAARYPGIPLVKTTGNARQAIRLDERL